MTADGTAGGAAYGGEGAGDGPNHSDAQRPGADDREGDFNRVGPVLAAKVEGGDARIPDLTADLGAPRGGVAAGNSAVFASKTASREERVNKCCGARWGQTVPRFHSI